MFNFTKTPMKSEQTGQYLTFKLSRRNSHNAPFSTQKELRKALKLLSAKFWDFHSHSTAQRTATQHTLNIRHIMVLL
jgi:hypothetical protein